MNLICTLHSRVTFILNDPRPKQNVFFDNRSITVRYRPLNPACTLKRCAFTPNDNRERAEIAFTRYVRKYQFPFRHCERTLRMLCVYDPVVLKSQWFIDTLLGSYLVLFLLPITKREGVLCGLIHTFELHQDRLESKNFHGPS